MMAPGPQARLEGMDASARTVVTGCQAVRFLVFRTTWAPPPPWTIASAPAGPRQELGGATQALVQQPIGPRSAAVTGRDQRRERQVVGGAHADDERVGARGQDQAAIGGHRSRLDAVRPRAGAVRPEQQLPERV